MKSINTKNHNVIVCDCGSVIEFEKTDYILQKTDESGAFYAIGVKCPVCGCLHVKNPEDFDGNALLSTLKGGKKPMRDCSWEEIKEACEAYYKRGGDVPAIDQETEVLPFSVEEEKEITLKDGSTYAIAFYGRNRFLERVTGKRQPLVFGFKELYGTNEDGGARMNEDCTNAGGWEASKMRKFLNEEFYALLPEDVQSYIKTIKIMTVNKGKKPTETEDKIFLPSEAEVFGKAELSAAGEGEQFAYFEKWRNRVKGYQDGNYGRWWWLRSPYSGYYSYFCIVSSGGSCGGSSAHSATGVSPCFAI